MELVIAAIVFLAMVVSWCILPATAVAGTIEREEVAPLASAQPQV